MTTIELLLKKYGSHMTLPEVAEALKVDTQTLYNRRSAGRLPIPMKKSSDRPRARLLAQVSDVAEYLDGLPDANPEG